MLDVFEDVFEALRYLENGHPIINLKDKNNGYLKRHPSFQLFEMPDGTLGAFPSNMFISYYRGENDDYDCRYPCKPSIYRVKTPEERNDEGKRKSDLVLIDLLKIEEFELVLQNFPQVKYAIRDSCNLDYKALAQHYELNTDLLDLTCDIAVAAFFATHSFDVNRNDYLVKENGTGCIRVYNYLFPEQVGTQEFRMIGLQPFQRPGQQCAFAVRMSGEENFADFSGKVLFKQNHKWNSKLHEAFYEYGNNILFPKEDISDIAKLIKDSNCISNLAVSKFSKDRSLDEEYILEILKSNNITISSKLSYTLTRQQRRNLERKFDGRPYGDVEIYSRLICKPLSTQNDLI